MYEYTYLLKYFNTPIR